MNLNFLEHYCCSVVSFMQSSELSRWQKLVYKVFQWAMATDNLFQLSIDVFKLVVGRIGDCHNLTLVPIPTHFVWSANYHWNSEQPLQVHLVEIDHKGGHTVLPTMHMPFSVQEFSGQIWYLSFYRWSLAWSYVKYETDKSAPMH